MLTRRQYRQTDILVITAAVALLIALAIARVPATALGNLLVAVPWFALVAAIVTLVSAQASLTDDDQRLPPRTQALNLIISILIAGLSYPTVIAPLFIG